MSKREERFKGLPTAEIIEYYKDNYAIKVMEKFGISRRELNRITSEAGFIKPKPTWADVPKEKRKEASLKAQKTKLAVYGKRSVTDGAKISKTRLSPEFKKKYHKKYSDSAKLAYANGTRIAPMTLPEARQAMVNLWASRTPEEIAKIVGKRQATLLERYGVLDHRNIGLENREAYWKSEAEAEIMDFIRNLGFEARSDRTIIGPKELDVYVPEKKLAIEYNGTFWHSEDKKDKYYHYEKTKRCSEAGVRLIHIFEWDWLDPVKKEIILSIIKTALGVNDSKIYARKCEIRKVATQEYRRFCEENHLQGYRAAKLVYGLYNENELVQLSSFSMPQKRGSKLSFDFELVRNCTRLNTNVVGGVQKLFATFVKENPEKSVMSYCDLSKFNGKSYEDLGLSLISETKANAYYINIETGKPSQWLKRGIGARSEQLSKSFVVYGAGVRKYGSVL